MGFLTPNLPHLDLDEWHAASRSERIRPMARHLAENGFGTPGVVYLLYVLKIGLYVLGGGLFALHTQGIDGFGNLATWWAEPVVFEKLVLWSMLFEVLGLGCGFGPLNSRFFPPLGSFLYWLRPGTVRLAPWPGRIPGTAGTRRGVLDVLFYAGLLVALVIALLSDGARSSGSLHAAVGMLPTSRLLPVLVLLGLIGLRDKTVFLAARAEVYGTLAVTFLLPGADAMVGAKLVILIVWLGAATSKLNKHFPFVVAAMLANSPVFRPRALKRRLVVGFPEDLRPSGLAVGLAHGGTVVEFVAPLVLFFSPGGLTTTVAAVVMVMFHLAILSSIPMGVPLEWNVFMIFGVLSLFVDKAGFGLSDVAHPLPVLAVVAVLIATVVLGNLVPTKVSFLPGMRYYAGNWDTTMWCFTSTAVEKFSAHVVAAASMPHVQLEKFYGAAKAEVPLYLGYAFRGFNTHGRALFTLVSRACAGRPEPDYLVIDGEMVAGTVLGWNFGDGHLHGEALVAAVQQRCRFEPGEVRVVTLDAQPIHRSTQQYRILDAATGELERGEVRVADMVVRQPWDADVPLHVLSPGTAETAVAADLVQR
jgi:hypothetical protein